MVRKPALEPGLLEQWGFTDFYIVDPRLRYYNEHFMCNVQYYCPKQSERKVEYIYFSQCLELQELYVQVGHNVTYCLDSGGVEGLSATTCSLLCRVGNS